MAKNSRLGAAVARVLDDVELGLRPGPDRVIDLNNAVPLPAWQRLVEPGPYNGPVIHPTVAGSSIVFAVWPLVPCCARPS